MNHLNPSLPHPVRLLYYLWRFLLLTMATLFLFLYGCNPAHAAQLDPQLLRRAVVGEAAGQPYLVKLGVACAVRNRGGFHGVYGVTAKHNATEPDWVWRQADRAVRESLVRDIVKGADHFGNRDDVRKGTFRGMKLCAVLGTGRDATYFYKRV